MKMKTDTVEIRAPAGGGAERVLKHIATESGSKKYPRAFSDWEAGAPSVTGTIGDRYVTLTLGSAEPTGDVVIELMDISDAEAPPYSATGPHQAVIGTELDDEQVASYAGLIAAAARKGTFGKDVGSKGGSGGRGEFRIMG